MRLEQDWHSNILNQTSGQDGIFSNNSCGTKYHVILAHSPPGNATWFTLVHTNTRVHSSKVYNTGWRIRINQNLEYSISLCMRKFIWCKISCPHGQSGEVCTLIHEFRRSAAQHVSVRIHNQTLHAGNTWTRTHAHKSHNLPLLPPHILLSQVVEHTQYTWWKQLSM